MDDFGVGLGIGIIIAVCVVILFVFLAHNAVLVDSNIVVNDLDKTQIKEIKTYLATKYPNNFYNSNYNADLVEKTTIIYVYQNGTPIAGCKT
jgi:hypothetical protein